METMTHAQLRRLTKDTNQVFFGFGFEWTPKHSQRLYDLQRINFRGIVAPFWLMRLAGLKAVSSQTRRLGSLHPRCRAAGDADHSPGIQP
jgi:hypothetical protein